MTLLALDEPAAFETVRPGGASPYVLLCDHASSRLPRALGTLGLSEAARMDHIGWDIGAAKVARVLSEALDAPLVLCGYSRLAIDANRPPGTPASIPEVTCEVPVPGNRGLGEAERRAREEELFWPYHRAIEALLRAREDLGVRSMIVSVHSFTPRLYGEDRPWHAGVMYNRDRRLAAALLAALADEPGLVVGDNKPYHVTDGADYGVPVYAERAGRPGVLLELRQDLVAQDDGALKMARIVARGLGRAAAMTGERDLV
jgi:predicted N-formylglutamate amidohydrolase